MADTNEPVDTGPQQPDIAARNAVEAARNPPDDKAKDDEGDDADEAQNTEDSADSDGSDAPARPKNKGVGKRINELTKEKHDALREREYWREEAERLRAQQQPRQEPREPQAAESSNGEKTLEDFDYDQMAFMRYLAKEEAARTLYARDQYIEQSKRQQTFQEAEAAFIAEHPDYQDVVSAPHVPLTQQVSAVIREADNPPAIAYYLATHLDEAAAIAQMHPIQMARAIGRIEHSLSAPERPATPPSPPTTVTKAPAPVATLKSAGKVSKDLDEMSMTEYVAERNRQQAAQRGR